MAKNIRRVTFLYEAPDDGDYDYDDVREQIGNGTADLYADHPHDNS